MQTFHQLAYIPTLAERLQLEPADVVVVPKSSLNLVKHMINYWGLDAAGGEWYLENNPQTGVRWISGDYVDKTYFNTEVRRFAGTPSDRAEAIKRATSLIGRPYHLTRFNCEHYANYVQTGTSFSKQSDNGVGLAALGLTVIILSKL
jgi:hypothetical protein